MLKNYLKTGLRNLSRNKAYTILNVLGLALGIGCALVIYKVVVFENSFDMHHSNADKIYRIVTETKNAAETEKGMGTPHPLGPALRQDFSEVKKVVRTHNGNEVQFDVKNANGGIDKFLIEEQFAFTEPDFFQIFDVEFIAGDKETALSKPNTAVISRSMAQKLYGLTDGNESEAIGRLISYAAVSDFEVVGVIKDPVDATNFPFHILMEYDGQNNEEINPYYGEGKKWNSTSSSTNTYILVDHNFNSNQFEEGLLQLVKDHYEKEEATRKTYLLQHLSEIHSDEVYGNYVYSTPNQLLSALSVIAIFLVLTACINFINLSTAQAANRSKEIGIRKAIGGYTEQLVTQFFIEVSLITLFSLFCALAIAEFMFVYLEDIIDTRLYLDLLDGFSTIGFMLILLIVVSFLSGIYPSILLSRMNTVLALKNKITARNNSGGLSLRKALVVAQFAISQFLIIGTVIIAAQMDYFLTKDLGFEKEAIVKAYLPERDEVKNERFRQLMKEDASIANVSFALSSPTGNSDVGSNFNYAPLESADDYQATYKLVDEEYLKLYGLKLLAGRNLTKSDTVTQALINRKVADLMGFQKNYTGAIGEKLSSGFHGQELTVVGVVENFHSQSLSEDIQFSIFIRMPMMFYEVAYKTIDGSDLRAGIAHFEKVWNQVYPEYVTDWNFFDEQLAENYEQEQIFSALMSIFSVVSIIIGCLGLYGLIAFISANRTKEVGIRKALGASVISIVGKFSKEVFILVVISFLIAAPAAYFTLNEWLSNYQFRIDMGVGFFALAFLATLIIAAITVSHRTICTALINPATTLKDE